MTETLKKINHHLGTPGWISIGTLIIVLLALGAFGHGRHNSCRREKGFREGNSRQENMMNRGERGNFPGGMMRNIEGTTDSNFSSVSDTMQYNVSVKDGQVEWFFRSSDTTGSQDITQKLTALGLKVEQNNNNISFQGKIDDTNKILQVMK